MGVWAPGRLKGTEAILLGYGACHFIFSGGGGNYTNNFFLPFIEVRHTFPACCADRCWHSASKIPPHRALSQKWALREMNQRPCGDSFPEVTEAERPSDGQFWQKVCLHPACLGQTFGTWSLGGTLVWSSWRCCDL